MTDYGYALIALYVFCQGSIIWLVTVKLRPYIDLYVHKLFDRWWP